MKSFVKLLALALVVIMPFLQSCKKQSELELKDFAGKATITGSVQYYAGVTIKDGVSFEDYQLAVGQTVEVIMDASQLDPAASGDLVYETVVDENGQYSIEVPFGVKPVTVSVKVKAFSSTFSIPNNYNEYTVIEDVLFGANYTEDNFKLVNGQVYTLNFNLKPDHSYYDYDDMDKVKVKVSGYVKYNGWKVTSGGYTTGNVPYANKPIVVNVYSNYSDAVFYYDVTTDANGYFTCEVPVPNYNSAEIRLIVNKNYIDNSFEHHYYNVDLAEWQTQKTSVYYEGEEEVDIEYTTEGVFAHEATLELTAYPVSLFGLYGIGNPDLDIKDGAVVFTYGNLLGSQWSWKW